MLFNTRYKIRLTLILLCSSLWLVSCSQFLTSDHTKTSTEITLLETQTHSSPDPKKHIPLLVKRISIDTEKAEHLNQIVFWFNQNVAEIGDIPNLAQINAIDISHNLKENCTWRFINLNNMACDLTQPVDYFTHYQVSVSKNFKAMNLSLSEPFYTRIETTLPEFNFNYGNNAFPIKFPTKIELTLPEQFRISDKRLMQFLRLKYPNGELKSVSVSLLKKTHRQSVNRKQRYNIEFEVPPKSIQTGLYSIVLITGFSLDNEDKNDTHEKVNFNVHNDKVASNRTQVKKLTQNKVIDTFNYQTDLVFNGFYCHFSGHYAGKHEPVTLKNGIVDCPPEKIALSFSMPLLKNSHRNKVANHQLDWLTGHHTKTTLETDNTHAVSTTNAQYEFLYNKQDKFNWLHRFSFNGGQNYQLDLSKVKSINHKTIKNPKIINFKTQDSTPLWQINHQFGNVFEHDQNSLPLVVRRNTKPFNQTITPINSANELLSFLNGTLKLGKLEQINQSHSPYKKTIQPIHFRTKLTNASGLANIKLSGLSMLDDYNFTQQDSQIIKTKTATFMANSAAFNLAVWHSQDLLIQAINWQAKPIHNAQVQLVCKNQKTPKLLGKTNHQGLLWIKPKAWQVLRQKTLTNQNHVTDNRNDSVDNCWIWTQNNEASAAIELPNEQSTIDDTLSAYAWTAQPVYQPGESISIGFIARRRSDNQLVPTLTEPASLAHYQLELFNVNAKITHTIKLTDVSKFGFSQAQHQLKMDAELGKYLLILRHIRSNDTMHIGQFYVGEFTPPEFEQSIQLPALINYNDRFNAVVSANKMNGYPLKNAKTKIHYTVQPKNKAPKHWPNNYTFQSWKDGYRSKSDADRLKPITFALSDKGQANFASLPVQSKIPLGHLYLVSEITSDDGETQYKKESALYFSRSHYIGTQFNTKTQFISLIAVDPQGNPVTNIQTHVTLKASNNINDDIDADNEYRTVKECIFEQLPAQCKVPAGYDQINLEIQSRELKAHNTFESISDKAPYVWYRDIYDILSHEDSSDLKLALEQITRGNTTPQRRQHANIQNLKITTDQTSIKVGESVTLNIHSPISGQATFILQAGDIQKVWQQNIQLGQTSLTLISDPSWQPHARIYVSLPIARTLAQSNHSNRDATSQNAHGTSNNLDPQRRFLTAKQQIVVNPIQNKPIISLSATPKKAQAGSKITLNIRSSEDADSQIWLVNEGVLKLMDMDESDFSHQLSSLTGKYAFESSLQFSALTDQLNTKTAKVLAALSAADISSIDEFIQVTGVRNSEAFRTRGLMLGDGDSGNINLQQFASSVWLDTVRLRKNKTHTIQVKLPQLIGRWKIFAINATQQTLNIHSTSVSTVRDIEYFIDTPKVIFSHDKAQFSITQINKHNQSITDTLKVWLNDQVVKTINLSLIANDYQKTHFTLPNLTSGQYRLKLTSKQQPDFETSNTLTVLSPLVEQQNNWLMTNSDNAVIHSTTPNNASGTEYSFNLNKKIVPNSVVLSVLPSEKQSPVWTALAQYHKSYPHQCWEQSISRAVSYFYNPVAAQTWQQGEFSLRRLIQKKSVFGNMRYGFGYFPQLQPDPLLTAYTALASGWLKNSKTPIQLEHSQLKSSLLNMINDKDDLLDSIQYSNNYTTGQINWNRLSNTTAHAQSMALLALAQHQLISLSEALKLRQTIGLSDAYASVLQALALKILGAERNLYVTDMNELFETGYQDEQQNIFNQNSQKCFAALVYDSEDAQQAHLINSVIQYQQKQGHFGSTLADAVCSFALKDKLNSAYFSPVSFNRNDTAQINYKVAHSDNENASNTSHWLKISYQQHIQDLQAVANGLQVTRQYFLQQNDQWVEISPNQILNIGDIVKVSLVLKSPTLREHLAIVDSIPGGFEAINPTYKNQFYKSYTNNDWRRNNTLELKNNTAKWYLRRLPKGQTKLTYINRVRHSGTYHTAPARAEAMYRNDIFSHTAANMIYVK